MDLGFLLSSLLPNSKKILGRCKVGKIFRRYRCQQCGWFGVGGEWPQGAIMFRIDGDRRTHPRLQIERPCKLFDPTSGKYYAGQTRDLSENGLLIDVPRLLELKPGDSVHVGVAMKRRQGLLLAKEMIEAIVVRSMATVDDHTTLAVRFDAAVVSAADIQAVRLAA